jgi:hypothetical protein
MEEVDPETALSAVESEQERRRGRAVEALEWFKSKRDAYALVRRGEVVEALADEMGWSEEQANQAVGDVVVDIVYQVQQVVHPEHGKLVGIIEYRERPDSGAYGYVDYDDVAGRRRRVVCSQCVVDSETDAEVAHATEGEGTTEQDASWEELFAAIEDHYATAHGVQPSEVKVGASLASGTTISGNTAFHSGNDGPGSGLDADTLDGSDSSDLGDQFTEVASGKISIPAGAKEPIYDASKKAFALVRATNDGGTGRAYPEANRTNDGNTQLVLNNQGGDGIQVEYSVYTQ